MFDGQNVFDEATSFAGEWHVDETCEQLIPAGEIEPIIVVAVANGELGRTHEYTPWFDSSFGVGGGGEQHLQDFITVLMPWVDSNYRTLVGPQATGISGSSLGGLMSLYAAYAHAESFGRIGALSPSLWWADHEMINWAATLEKPDVRAYMDMGTLESGVMVDENNNGIDDSIDDLRAMRDVMLSQGFVLDEDLKVVEDEGAQHNEFYWAARFPDVLRYLFPPNTVDTDIVAAKAVDLSVAPNPFLNRTTLRFEIPALSRVNLVVYNVSGRRVRVLADAPRAAGIHELVWNGHDESGAKVGSGIYFVHLDTQRGAATRKLVLHRDSR
jgi:predicted alpha/beta superfamily hydrolase